MPSRTTVVDVTMTGKWDVYVGRARVKSGNPKFRAGHALTAPYIRHDGDPDWRETAKDEYRDHHHHGNGRENTHQDVTQHGWSLTG